MSVSDIVILAGRSNHRTLHGPGHLHSALQPVFEKTYATTQNKNPRYR